MAGTAIIHRVAKGRPRRRWLAAISVGREAGPAGFHTITTQIWSFFHFPPKTEMV